MKKLVEDENKDRMLLVTADAQKAKRELREVMEENYTAARANAHAGEWIEVPDPEKPESFKLEQKR